MDRATKKTMLTVAAGLIAGSALFSAFAMFYVFVLDPMANELPLEYYQEWVLDRLGWYAILATPLIVAAVVMLVRAARMEENWRLLLGLYFGVEIVGDWLLWTIEFYGDPDPLIWMTGSGLLALIGPLSLRWLIAMQGSVTLLALYPALVSLAGFVLALVAFVTFTRGSTDKPEAVAPAALSAGTPSGQSQGSGEWIVRLPGQPENAVNTATLQMWARSGVIKRHTMVQEVATGHTYSAEQIPRVFSEKSFTTAVLFSVFLGSLGIDRLYLGYLGLGILKLLTFGGFGVWWLVDLILIAIRKIADADGRSLA